MLRLKERAALVALSSPSASAPDSSSQKSHAMLASRPPRCHTLFSSPTFNKASAANGSKSAMVGEKDAVGEDEEVVLGLEDDDEVMRRMHGKGLKEEDEEGGGWLEGDDIEEWD
jgi:hypothetical protein